MHETIHPAVGAPLRLRQARGDDAGALHEIYRPHVEGSAVSLEDPMPTVLEVQQRIEVAAAERPWLVAELGGRVVGYAYAGSFRSRAGYRWSAETALYVAADAQRRGVGRALYAALVSLSRAAGLRTLVAVITLPNDASVATHEAMGFVASGVWPRSGYKAGAWRDVGVWVRSLGPFGHEPREPLPFSALGAEAWRAAGLGLPEGACSSASGPR